MGKFIFIKDHINMLAETIEKNQEDLDIIVYHNFLTELQIGSENMNLSLIDSIITINNISFAILKGSKIDTNDLIVYFNNNNLMYSEIYMYKPESMRDDKLESDKKEICLVENIEELEDTLNESMNNDQLQVVHYFNKLPGYLEISFMTTSEIEKVPVELYQFRGIITTSDKIIIPIDNTKVNNKSITHILDRNGIYYEVCNQGQPHIRKKNNKIKVYN